MMDKWSTRTFWIGLLERVVSTFGEAALAVLIAGGAATLTGVDWLYVFNVAGLAAVIALLKGFAAPETTDTAVKQYHDGDLEVK